MEQRTCEVIDASREHLYVDLILGLMRAKHVRLRDLAAQASLSKSRLGVLLHRDAAKRSALNVAELQAILKALGIDMLSAVIRAETLQHVELTRPERYQMLVSMLCRMFHGLPAAMIQALEQVDEMDGTEVRLDWAPVLQRAIIKRVMHEITAIIGRRAAINELSLLS